MSTPHYNLPTIIGTDTFSSVDALNGLANATDAALWGLHLEQEPYTLPVATTLKLGGVRPSNQIVVRDDGTMLLANDAITGANIVAGSLTGDLLAPGAIAGGIGAGTITGDKLAPGSVTGNAIAGGTITADKLAPGVIPDGSGGSLGPNTVGTAELKNGAVTIEKLDQTLLRTVRTPFDDKQVMGGRTYGNYTYQPLVNMVIVKIFIDGMSLPANQGDVYLWTLPQGFRPQSQQTNLIGLRTDVNGVFYLNIKPDGTVSLGVGGGIRPVSDLYVEGSLSYFTD